MGANVYELTPGFFIAWAFHEERRNATAQSASSGMGSKPTTVGVGIADAALPTTVSSHIRGVHVANIVNASRTRMSTWEIMLTCFKSFRFDQSDVTRMRVDFEYGSASKMVRALWIEEERSGALLADRGDFAVFNPSINSSMTLQTDSAVNESANDSIESDRMSGYKVMS